MSQLVKRQHYVPRVYLKRFGFSDKGKISIQVLPKESTDNDSIFSSNIENVALKKHLYTLTGKTVEEKMLIEKFYSDELESNYNQIYELLVDESKIDISPEERELIIATVITMYYRTHNWLNQIQGLSKEVYRRMFDVCEQTGKDYFMMENEKVSIAGKTFEEFVQEKKEEERALFAATQLKAALRLIDIKKEHVGIMVVKLDDGEKEFITSDNPVVPYKQNVNHITPFDPENKFSLPLDSKHLLIIMPYTDEISKYKIIRLNHKGSSAEGQRLVSNYEQMQSSEKFMFGSKSGLEGYLKTKEETEKPI